MITALGLKLLVYPALALTCIAPIVLIALMWKDKRDGNVW